MNKQSRLTELGFLIEPDDNIKNKNKTNPVKFSYKWERKKRKQKPKPNQDKVEIKQEEPTTLTQMICTKLCIYDIIII